MFVEQSWTGRMNFGVFSMAGLLLGEELVGWLDVVGVWLEDCFLGVMDREAVRQWLDGDRREAFVCHDVTLVTVDDRLAIRLSSDQLPHRLPTHTAARLTRL